MIEMELSRVQSRLDRLLGERILIVNENQKAVLLPYEEYLELLEKVEKREDSTNSTLRAFRGRLDPEVQREESRYRKLLEAGR